jgi:hypothetical protein
MLRKFSPLLLKEGGKDAGERRKADAKDQFPNWSMAEEILFKPNLPIALPRVQAK